ncbi:hypothetical protein LTR10_003429 [Elasticomyces elasticus]|nr:hypothetical protein LTR10_003429 [Elasticomyces elasticus]KAK4969697.1 hypothetical protein LTR42_008969 [Elasticomyces elasticus]
MPAQPEKSWRWEAPSVPGFGAPPPAMPSVGLMGFARAKRKDVKVEVRTDPRKVVRESERAFKDLLKGCEGGKEVDETTTKSMVEFLQSSKDEPKAQNLHTLTKWLRGRIISIGALQTLCQHLLTKARLRTLEMEKLHATLALILTNLPSQDEGIEASLSSILESLSEADRHTTLLRLAQLIRTTHSTNKPSITIQSQASATTIIRTLFRILSACPSLQAPHPETHATQPTWSQIYRRLGTLLEPAALASHLCALPRNQMSEVLLRFWVRKYLVKASLATLMSEEDSASMIDHGVFKRLDSLSSASAITDPTATVLEKLISSYETVVQKSVGDAEADPLVTLLVVLARGKVKYTRFLSDVLRLLAAGQTRREVWQTFNTLRLNRSFGIPSSVAKELVLYLAASGKKGDVLLAYRVFVTCPSLSLLGVPDLALQMIEAGLGSPDRIFRLLNRRAGVEVQAREVRQTRTLALHPAQVDLAHLVAYHWADHPSTSARVSFRRVWETYRWLRDRGAPLSPLISRALVRAGVLRQMSEGKNVSLSQLRYILGIVARVEGDGVAMDLDSMVWEPNKRLRALETVARRAEVRGREVEARLVRGARWRVRLWAKRRRGWFDHRGRVERRRRGGRGEEGVRRVETPWQDVWREEDAGGICEGGMREGKGASWIGGGAGGREVRDASRDDRVAVDVAHITAGSSTRFLKDEPMVGYDPAGLADADDIAVMSGVASEMGQASTLLSVSGEQAKGEVVVRYILELDEEDGVWQEGDGVELVEAGVDQSSRGEHSIEEIVQEADGGAAMESTSQLNPAATRFSSADDEVDLLHDVASSRDVYDTMIKSPFTSPATYARAVPATLVPPLEEEGVVRFVEFHAKGSLSHKDVLAVELPGLGTAEDTSVEMHDDTSAFAEPVGSLMPTYESGVHPEGYLQADAHLPITLTATNTSLHPSDPDSATVHYVSSVKTARDEAQRQHLASHAYSHDSRNAAKVKPAKVIMKKLLAPAEQRTGVVTGHHEKKDRELNAAAWRAFGKTMYTKRKKSGYDPYAGK